MFSRSSNSAAPLAIPHNVTGSGKSKMAAKSVPVFAGVGGIDAGFLNVIELGDHDTLL